MINYKNSNIGANVFKTINKDIPILWLIRMGDILLFTVLMIFFVLTTYTNYTIALVIQVFLVTPVTRSIYGEGLLKNLISRVLPRQITRGTFSLFKTNYRD